MKMFLTVLFVLIFSLDMGFINAEQFLPGFDPGHILRTKSDYASFDSKTVSKLSAYPDLIYSKFMKETFYDLSDKCSQDVQRIINDLASSEPPDYALESEYLFTELVFYSFGNKTSKCFCNTRLFPIFSN